MAAAGVYGCASRRKLDALATASRPLQRLLPDLK
jgi:hypothetical protein